MADEHIIDYYLNNGRLIIAKASNRLMAESKKNGVPYWAAYDEVLKMEEAIHDISKKLWERKAQALRISNEAPEVPFEEIDFDDERPEDAAQDEWNKNCQFAIDNPIE